MNEREQSLFLVKSVWLWRNLILFSRQINSTVEISILRYSVYMWPSASNAGKKDIKKTLEAYQHLTLNETKGYQNNTCSAL